MEAHHKQQKEIMKLKFTETTKTSSGKETTKVIYIWRNITKTRAHIVCASFMEAFIYAYTRKGDLRYNCIFDKQGYQCWTWNYHKEGFSGRSWEFRNGKNKIMKF